jgi:hypothetical protein
VRGLDPRLSRAELVARLLGKKKSRTSRGQDKSSAKPMARCPGILQADALDPPAGRRTNHVSIQ